MTVQLPVEKLRYTAILGAEGVTASTPYVLVDLSDTTNFKHTKTGWLSLEGLNVHAEKASDGAYDVWVGVVTECDATDGSAEWVHCFHLESVGNATDSTDRFAQSVDFTLGGSNPMGIPCLVDTANDTLAYVATNQSQADNANWQNDTNRTSPVGATTKPSVGDVVVWAEEVTGSGTLDFFLSCQYNDHD